MEIKSQDQIQFENLYSNSLGTWWSAYPPGSLGNIIHWVYVYTMLHIAEEVTIGNNEVRYRGDLLARFTLNEKLQMPIFYDINDEIYPYFSKNQECFIKGLKTYKDYVEEMNERYAAVKQAFKQN